MATTVGEAFDLFIKDSVNLDSGIVFQAKKIRDELLEEIHQFDRDGEFFKLWSEFDVHFGSFSRKTKCRPLDDLDLMIGISAEGNTYNGDSDWDDISMNPSNSSAFQQKCKHEDGTLSSNMVLGKFKERIKEVNDLRSVEVKKNQQAIVVNFKTSDWSFDIVPCFHTKKDSDGRDYYLIPNGSGKWMKTDPIIDRRRVDELEEK
ncbi:MAG TPA: hypothetical protein P5154_08365, partial [Candidatus Izemoplasmatales bacterium]|nr:hypothetical protein [Candidatus Izemoplasmatales bacterium]